MRPLLFTVVVLLVPASSAFAQLAGITTVTQQIYAPGVSTITGTPAVTQAYVPSLFVCNQTAPSVPVNVVNPRQFFFNDDVNIGKVCIATLAASTLAGLPNGSGYQSTVTVTDSSGQTSPRSAASNPFDVAAVPSARTGYKVL